MAACRVRYWAAAKAAAGTHEELYDAATLADLLAAARNGHGRDLAIVLDRSTFLIDGVAVGSKPHDDVVLADDTGSGPERRVMFGPQCGVTRTASQLSRRS